MVFSQNCKTFSPRVENLHLPRRMDDSNCIITCSHVITGCCSFTVQVRDVYDFNTPNTASSLGLREERQQIHNASQSNWIKQTVNGGSVLCYCGRGQAKEERNIRTKERERKRGGENLFRILRAIRHVPRDRCEEVTLRRHVPHCLLHGDRCAVHGPQEYGPAAGKGHAEEPSGLHTEDTCRHWEGRTQSDHCMCGVGTYADLHRLTYGTHPLSPTIGLRLQLCIICNI